MRATLVWATLLFGMLLPVSAADEAADVEDKSENPRGVILISVDTLRADHLGLYGYDRPTSPYLDRLAKESIVFEDMLAHAPNTPPSHMSMLTGLLPPEHGYYGYHAADAQTALSPDIKPLATLLGEHGFSSAGFTGGGWMNFLSGFERGFDVYQGFAQVPIATSAVDATK